MPDPVVVDTDILVDAGRGVNAAVSCLHPIEQRLTNYAVTGSVTGC